METPRDNPEINGDIILSELANRVLAIANLASEVVMKYYKQVLDVDYKKDQFDPVTIADREADGLIREQLQKEFPDDASQVSGISTQSVWGPS